MTEKNREEIPFEESLKRLEEIVRQLEEGEVPLSRSLALFEEGMGTARQCSLFLQKAEERINILMEDEKGELHLSPPPFSLEEEGG